MPKSSTERMLEKKMILKADSKKEVNLKTIRLLKFFKNKFIIVFYTFLFLSSLSAQSIKNLKLITSNNYNLFNQKETHGFSKNNSSWIEIDLNKKTDQFELGANFLFSKKNNQINELFLKINTNHGKFIIGKHYNFYKYNSSQSVGNLLESENSPSYLRLTYNNEFNFYNYNLFFDFSNGVLDKNTVYVDPPFIHSKAVYVKRKLKGVDISLGLSHYVIWGGETSIGLYGYGGKMPTGFKNFLRVVGGNPGDDSAPDTEQNALGDAFGMWDFSLKKINNKMSLLAYYQNYFNDGSGMEFKNNFDGLWGLEIFNEKNSFLVEYLKTTHQSGNFHPPGVDSYYWNGLYYLGWTYEGLVVGTPYVTPYDNRVKLFNFSYSYEDDKFSTGFSAIYIDRFISFNGAQMNEEIDLSNDRPVSDYEFNLFFKNKFRKNLFYTINIFKSKSLNEGSSLKIEYLF